METPGTSGEREHRAKGEGVTGKENWRRPSNREREVGQWRERRKNEGTDGAEFGVRRQGREE